MNGDSSSASSPTALQGPANPTGNVQFTYYNRAPGLPHVRGAMTPIRSVPPHALSQSPPCCPYYAAIHPAVVSTGPMSSKTFVTLI